LIILIINQEAYAVNENIARSKRFFRSGRHLTKDGDWAMRSFLNGLVKYMWPDKEDSVY